MNKKIMIIAGEASGDLHGSALITELKKLDPELELTGIGGSKMEKAGMEIIYHIQDMAFLGFAEVVKHLPFIRKVRDTLLEKIERENIKEVVLIDYPGFNLNFARKIKARGVKVIYYISPQIWAWGQKRIKKIRMFVDKMIVLFPFEKEFYKDAGVDVECVGHPLVERIDEYNFLSKDELYDKLSLSMDKEILLIMPGSRKQEVERIFTDVLKGAEKIAEKYNMHIVAACSENISEDLLHQYSEGIEYKVAHNLNYDLLRTSKFGIIKSGTSTVEAGYLQLPGIVVYRTNKLTYLIGKALIKVNNIAMANIIAGKTLFRELIQDEVTPSKIFEAADNVLSDSSVYNRLKEELLIIKERLGETGASKKAAELIIAELNEA